jgi:hypothetical protein
MDGNSCGASKTVVNTCGKSQACRKELRRLGTSNGARKREQRLGNACRGSESETRKSVQNRVQRVENMCRDSRTCSGYPKHVRWLETGGSSQEQAVGLENASSGSKTVVESCKMVRMVQTTRKRSEAVENECWYLKTT